MKKMILTLLAVFGGFTAVSAADLYVRDLGAGGAYATVSEAITAASDGDRIIIRPKSGGVPYLENISVNKSLTFVCEINYSKYLIQGTVQIVPAAGRVVAFHNLSVTGTISTTSNSPAGGRMRVNIFNSVVNGEASFDDNNVSVTISGTSVSGNLSLVHGIVTGNDLSNSIVYLNGDATTDLATTPVYAIGNKVKGFSLSSNTYAFHLYNNFVYTSNNTPIAIAAIKPGSVNLIQNNTVVVYSSITNNLISIASGAGQSGVVSIFNNILNGASAAYKVYNPGATITAYLYYNQSTSSMTNVFGVTSANNTGYANLTVNEMNGNATGANTNAGNPEEEYHDLDLTRNDIGNTGGSNAWANYWPANAAAKPQVYFLSTPRRVYTGGTNFTIEGGAFSK